MNLKIYPDGGARGNPGPAGYGLVIGHNQILYQESKFLGIKTNNEAEYLALIAALTWIKNNLNLPIISLSFFSDSQLLVRQIQGKYKVKAPNIKPLFNTCQYLLSQINLPYTITDIRRQDNCLADSLANQAMDHAPKR